jgi:hypothetical protein
MFARTLLRIYQMFVTELDAIELRRVEAEEAQRFAGRKRMGVATMARATGEASGITASPAPRKAPAAPAEDGKRVVRL